MLLWVSKFHCLKNEERLVLEIVTIFSKLIHFCLTVSKHSSLTIVELLRYNTVLGVVQQIQKTFYEITFKSF